MKTTVTMKTRTTTTAFAGVMLCALTALADAQPGNTATGRPDRWREDLDFFAKEFPARQKDFYALMPQERFERELADLKRQLPELSDRDIVFGVVRIAADLNVAHTGVAFGSIREAADLHLYPIELQWFSDGLAVMAAAPQYQPALGCRVVRMGKKTPEQAEAALAPYIAGENSAHLHFESPRYMTLVELMQREKIAEPGGSLHLACAKPDGGELEIDLAPQGLQGGGRNKWSRAAEVLHVPRDLCHRHPDSAYWFEYLPDSQTLYIQYNKCRNERDNPFADFVARVFEYADSHSVRRVIADLRFNAGGSSSVIKPLVDGLESRPALTEHGHLYAFIGSQTFSSGLMAAMDFRGLHAILMGAPTGNRPNHYGEQKNFSLPNSGLLVHYSTKHFHLMTDADPSALSPDVPVAYSLGDFLAGRDPVLAAAIQHPLQ
jgi:hypothetical protein